MPHMGTLAWMAKTQGKLRFRDRMAMIYQGVQAKAAAQKRMKLGVKARYTEVDDILPPDSAIAREAMQVSEEASAPYLFQHCLRAYFWARLLDDGTKKFDDEAVFTALMLHDLGLTDGHRLSGSAEQCFTSVGAKAVQKLAVKHNWTDARADLTASAITLHLNLQIREDQGPEAALVRAGTVGDVTGLGLDILHGDQMDAVVARHPRLQMKAEIVPPFRHEAKARPCCRAAFLHNKLGFSRLVRGAPFAE